VTGAERPAGPAQDDTTDGAGTFELVEHVEVAAQAHEDSGI
jgi:hypothetical protein